VIDLLNHARDSLAQEVSGQVSGERRFSVGDGQASEFVINVPPSGIDPAPQSAKIRLYVRVNGASVTVEQCVALGPRGWVHQPDAARFLDSVRFERG
jgi:hypothetical protein